MINLCWSCTFGFTISESAGVAVQGLSFSVSKELIPQYMIISFSVYWVKGTDVWFTLDFGDGTPAFAWDYLSAGHIADYNKYTKAISHKFERLGNFTSQLSINCSVISLAKSIAMVVEPDLQKYIQLNVSYEPNPPPNPVVFFAALIDPNLGTPPFVIWCSVDFDIGDDNTTDCDCENGTQNVFGFVGADRLNISHVYMIDSPTAPTATPTFICENHVSSMAFKTTIILRQPITELQIIPQRDYWMTSEVLQLNITLTTGSHLQVGQLVISKIN
jgi:hypothetical protein